MRVLQRTDVEARSHELSQVSHRSSSTSSRYLITIETYCRVSIMLLDLSRVCIMLLDLGYVIIMLLDVS